jgi:hypothetical protein
MGKFDAFGIMNIAKTPVFPFNLSFSVYLCLTNARGNGTARIVVVDADTQFATYVGDPHPLNCGHDPLQLHACTFRVPSCQFETPGLYLVQFVYNDEAISECSLRVEEL